MTRPHGSDKTLSLLPFQNSQVAFVFASEVEANDFYKKVSKRGKYLKGQSPISSESLCGKEIDIE